MAGDGFEAEWLAVPKSPSALAILSDQLWTTSNNLDDLPGSFPPPLIVDVRPKAAFESAGHTLSGANCRDPEPQLVVELMLAE